MTIRQKDRETTYQKILCLTLSVMLFFSPIIQFVNIFLIFLFWKVISIDSIILYGTQWVLTFISLWIVIKRVRLSTLLLPLLLLLLYVMSAAFNTDARQYMMGDWGDLTGNKFYWLFIYALPAFLLIRRVWDYDRLFRYMVGFSIPSLLCSVGILILYLIKDGQPGYMNFSYDLLLPSVVLLYAYFTKKKFLYLLGGFVACFIMFFCGARGPLLCLAFAILLYFMLMTEKQSTKLLVLLLFTVSVVLLLVLWDPITNFLFGVSESLGVNSRILEKIVDGTLADDSGRSDVRSILLPELNVFGHGLYGDRVLTEGRYAHNIIIELIVQYGLLLGSALVLLLMLLVVNGFITKDREKRLLFLVFFSIGFVKLLMSSSYLSMEPAFYCMLGICFSCLFNDDSKPKERINGKSLISLRYRGRR